MISRSQKKDGLTDKERHANRGRRTKGSAALEAVIAMVLLLVCLGAVFPLILENQIAMESSAAHSKAIVQSKEMLEKALAAARFDFNLLNPLAAIEIEGRTQSLAVAFFQGNPMIKSVQSTVSWKGPHGQALTTSLVSLFSNARGIENGETCNSVLENADGWKHPSYSVYATEDLTSNGAGIAISQVYASQEKLYVASNPPANTHTLFIFSLSNDPEQAPLFLGSLDNAPLQAGLNAVAVSGNYAYLANAYGANFTTCAPSNRCAQLQVADVSNPQVPVVVASIKIPGATGSAGQAIGTAVTYRNGYLYLGLAKTESGPEFNIFDVGGGGSPASPMNPIWKGGYAVGNGINAISVKNQYAYLATPNTENMTILDVTDPTNPARVGGAPALSGGNHGKSLSVVGNTLYLGRTFGQNEFYIFNTSNPETPIIAGSRDIGTGSQTSIHSIAIKDFLGFLLTRDQFQIWNMRDLSSPIPWTADGSANFLRLADLGGRGVSFFCDKDLFYVALSSLQGDGKDLIAIITPES